MSNFNKYNSKPTQMLHFEKNKINNKPAVNEDLLLDVDEDDLGEENLDIEYLRCLARKMEQDYD